jgi:TRAP-type mannitol/chloroaromatic compound transport system substrate-binding protein
MRTTEGTLISFATQPGNVAQDGRDGNSPYTKALAQTMRQPGLGLFDMFNEVGLAVKKSTGGSQQPWLSSSPITGSFYFSGSAAAVTLPPAADPDATVRADFGIARSVATKEAWDAFLQKYLTGFYADVARAERNRVAALVVTPTPVPVPAPISAPPLLPGSALPVDTPSIDAKRAPTLKFRLQNTYPFKAPTSLPLFARRLGELSGGRMSADVLPAGAVVPAYQLADAVKSGVLDLGFGTGTYLYGKERALGLLTAIPFGFAPRDQVTFRRRPDVAAIFDRLLAKEGLVALPCGSFGRNGEFWAKKPVNVTADLKGAKLRFVAMAIDIYSEVGVAVNALPGGELVTAIDRGLLDGGQYADPRSDLDLGFTDVAKVYYYPGSVLPGYVLDMFVSKSKWDAMAPTGRQIVEQACRESLDAMIEDYDRFDRDALAEIARRNITIAPIPAPVERDLYAASRKFLTKLAGENEAVRSIMAIVEQMRPSTVAAKFR